MRVARDGQPTVCILRVYCAYDAFHRQYLGNQQFFPYLWQNGGKVISPDGRQAVFDSPEGSDALQYWTDLIGLIDPPGTTVSKVPTGATALGIGLYAAQLAGNGTMFGIAKGSPDVVHDLAVAPPLKRQT